MKTRQTTKAALVIAVGAVALPAFAHDQWADGSAVPPWVKAMCCGENDVHRDVRIRYSGGQVYVEGLRNPVDAEKVFDSRDGHVWAFYSPYAGEQATVYCLFVPPSI